MRNYIRKKVTTRSLLELMAEESTELADASLELSKGCMKMIRARQCSDNPTPVTYDEAIDMVNDSFRMILEELQDVFNCAYLLGWYDKCGNYKKIERMARRLGYETGVKTYR